MTVTINGTTGIAGVDGSAATPAVQGADTNTGMFFPAADTIAFTEGGTEVMRIDSSGNVGIGTTAPITNLEIRPANVALNSWGNFAITTSISKIIILLTLLQLMQQVKKHYLHLIKNGRVLH